LYTRLYAIICQSEYARIFNGLKDGEKVSFDEEPFIQIEPSKKETWKITVNIEQPPKSSYSCKKDDTELSVYNKKMLCDSIIDSADLATQELLKLAISYRFAHYFYSGNPEVRNSSEKNTANDEEHLRIEKIANNEEHLLLGKMVRCIVREYNFFRKELKMNYSENELESGVPTIDY